MRMESLEPILIDKVGFAQLMGVSKETFRKLVAQDSILQPMIVGKVQKWVKREVIAWLESGPDLSFKEDTRPKRKKEFDDGYEQKTFFDPKTTKYA